MSVDLSSLLILANSGRAMAESAARGGFAVSVLDRFCDQDTRAAANCRRVGIDACGFDPEQLMAEIASLNPGRSLGVVYGAGLEGSPSLLHRLSADFELFGNEPAVLELLRDPATYFNLLDSLQVPYPEVRLSPPDKTTEGLWLVKKAASSGGQGVTYWSQEWTGTDSRYYYQRFIQGSPMSALFIANGESHQTIGYNRLKFSAAVKARPFLYSGAIGQMSLETSLRQQVERTIDKLVGHLNLRGVNSLDFILSNEEVYVLDLNTRPSATLELYEHQSPDGWMKQHIQACLGNLPGALPADTGVFGHQIVYASQAIEIPAGMNWPDWTRDRPVPGVRIARDEPLCSLFAQGRTPAEVEARLQHYQSRILAMISSLSDERIKECP